VARERNAAQDTDGRLVFTGSYNWSTNAEENNDENAVFIRNTP